MGTPDFAVPSLELLLENHYNVVAVITAPDKPSGRGQKLTPSPVKNFAQKLNIPVLQPPNLKDKEFVETLRGYNARLQVVVAFRMLPEVVWDMPSHGTINLHASLLPQYRGAAPINWVVINGERQTGVTTFKMQHEIDTGSIIYKEAEPVYLNDTAGSLHDRLKFKGAYLILNTVEGIRKGDYPLHKQETSEVIKKAPKITKEDCRINWEKTGEEIRNLVRGLAPHPGAWTTFQVDNKEKVFKIFHITPVGSPRNDLYPGEWTTDNESYLYVQTGDSLVSIDELQMEGKKKMDIQSFLRGHKL